MVYLNDHVGALDLDLARRIRDAAEAKHSISTSR